MINKMVKLNDAKIYKIVDKTNDNIYIGSTCRTLKKRLSEHKSNYEKFLKGLYGNTKSFEIIKNNDCEIELLENCEVKTKSELLARERYFIENTECVNKKIPGRTKQEWDDANKEYYKKYRDANKEKLTNKLKEKFECKCGGKYTYRNKYQHIRTEMHQNFLNL